MISKLKDLNNEIKTKEKEYAVSKDRLRKAKFEKEYKIAAIVATTPWKEHNITNEQGRHSYITLHTVDETETVHQIQKDTDLLELEVGALKRMYRILMEQQRSENNE